ncbi:MAG: VanZ family protein [Bacilli bacterium]|nr:VanZ family protein [Bacilli bacterium]
MKYTFLLSLFFELTQLTGLYFIYSRPYRLFDVDDLMINMLGGILGYFIMNKLKVLLPSREEINDSVKVSVLRKITSILIDIFINNKIINYIILIIYFVIIPTINNKNLGMNFVNIKYDVANKRILRIFLRQVIICLYSIYLIY